MAQAITSQDPGRLFASDETSSDVGPVRNDGRPLVAPVPLRPASEQARERFRATLARTLEKRTSDEQAERVRKTRP